MEFIKKVCISKKKKRSLEGAFNCLQDHSPRNDATTAFTPKDRGREETIAWLATGSPEHLVSLHAEQERATKNLQQPMTQGTKEVQLILDQPSRQSIEQLHNVKGRAEMAVRYGAPGIVAYNFSKSLNWNKAFASRVPSLQLRTLATVGRGTKAASEAASLVPFSPIDWLVLPEAPTAQSPRQRRRSSFGGYETECEEQPTRSLSPISEPGGWRDIGEIDIADSSLIFFPESESKSGHDSPVQSEDGVEEGKSISSETHSCAIIASECEAVAVQMIPVGSGQVHEVNI
ncbi:hypothetical protein F4777DRAFT_587298 [Nemania sp. FL0916]|nr:hypothetical protein F4777DRAFT_587298 [Nemania sp. FL0916]